MRGNQFREILTIAHSVQNWLPITQTWIYNQLYYMKRVQSLILAYGKQNLELFPWDLIIEARKFEDILFRAVRKYDIAYRRFPPEFDKAIKNYNPTLFHSHFGNRAWFDIPLVQKNDLKQVVTFYGFDVGMLPIQKPNWLERYQELFLSADLFLCEGPYMANSLIQLGCPSDKVIVHRLGIETQNIQYKRRKLGFGEPIKILIAGAFREKKGIPYAIEALALAKKKYPQIRITIIGDATVENRSKKEKQKILAVIKRNNLETVTRLLGFQPKDVLQKEAYQHHIFISPSVVASDGDSEGGAPVSIIEMAASGMPIISTKHCDIPQVIEHGKTGYLAEERNIDELYHYICQLIDNPGSWSEMTLSARKNIENKFDVSIQADELVNLYESIM